MPLDKGAFIAPTALHGFRTAAAQIVSYLKRKEKMADKY